MIESLPKRFFADSSSTKGILSVNTVICEYFGSHYSGPTGHYVRIHFLPTSETTVHLSPFLSIHLVAQLSCFLLVLCFLPVSFAETTCNPIVPPALIPGITSCNYALNLLQSRHQACGSRDVVFSPSAQG